MWWLLLILFLLPLAVLLVILTLPVEMELDTVTDVYEARIPGIFYLKMLPDSSGFRFEMRLFGWKKELGLGQKNVERSLEKPEKKVPLKKVRNKTKFEFGFHKFREVLRVMKQAMWFKKFRIDWDSGDFVLNARLYPLFQGLSVGKRQLHINFMGRRDLAILLQTRPGMLAWAGLRVYFILKRSGYANQF